MTESWTGRAKTWSGKSLSYKQHWDLPSLITRTRLKLCDPCISKPLSPLPFAPNEAEKRSRAFAAVELRYFSIEPLTASISSSSDNSRPCHCNAYCSSRSPARNPLSQLRISNSSRPRDCIWSPQLTTVFPAIQTEPFAIVAVGVARRASRAPTAIVRFAGSCAM